MSPASTCRIASEVPVTVAAPDHLGDVDPGAAQFVGGDGAVAVHLDVGLGAPAQRAAIDHRGESADDARVEHPVDAALPPARTGSPVRRSRRVARACSASTVRMRSSVSSSRSAAPPPLQATKRRIPYFRTTDTAPEDTAIDCVARKNIIDSYQSRIPGTHPGCRASVWARIPEKSEHWRHPVTMLDTVTTDAPPAPPTPPSRWTRVTPHTTSPHYPSWRPPPKAAGSPTSRATATWTAWRPTPR